MWQRVWKSRGLWLRVLILWVLGSALPFFDEVQNYDLRFHLRGPQEASKQIVLVYFDQEDWTAWHGANDNWLRSFKEYSIVSDSYFWRSTTWNQLLENILHQEPLGVGVTFFFNPDLPRPDESLTALSDSRVIWGGDVDAEGRPILPLMASSYGYNVALTKLRADEDLMLRRFSSPLSPLPHMGIKLSEALGHGGPSTHEFLGESRLIDFRGGANTYPSISALEVLQGRIPKGFFNNKIVIIGTRSVQSHQYQTPLGSLSRANVLAQVVDNVMGKRWIKRLPGWAYSFYMLVILLLAVLILVNYPQSMAFVFLLWLCLGTTALSLWIFDTFYFWIPALSPLIACLIAYVVFIGYQLSLKENQTWRLQQEKELLSELDQLRNNFVSLISHDLKTPIAKIQAICDRLAASPMSEDVREGLTSVRKESVELHRYIQSILQVSRLESSQLEVRKEATDLNETVEKVVEQLQVLARDKKQVVDIHLEPLFSIEVDGVLIREVVMNLVENAIKYTPTEGKIEVRTQEVDDKVVFTVTDNGPGVPSQDRDRLFEKFYRGQAQNGSVKGTGMGLYLVKYFIELHGGEVFLDSTVGKGTRVGFTLPLQA